ncbi:hypothetical protein WJX72_010864 [[Myrmecia] bisecta]|uniref:DUF1279 domain-containing protein n=1 Tax=[Myrmecia] bisecta TaxID=41462 RepID=A0AAW1PTN1_9CHLO
MADYSSRVRDLFKKYGKVGVGVHLTIYAATLAGCYAAAESKLDVGQLLIKYGLMSDKEVKDDASPEQRGWLANTLTHSGSSLAVAFLCTKALLPVRVPLTLTLTPMVARAIQRRKIP